MNGDINEANKGKLRSALSTSTTTAALTSSQKEQQINRRRAFFHQDVIITENQISSTTDETMGEDSFPMPNHSEENPTNKSFKRKAVSFSTMPFEKKVADGKIDSI